ncbi:MAG: hypothetical protein EBS84_00725 [Proteobacteria bacterium]|nr:hypothetical protein [Verrucomicrobiota bacterium]NBU07531.1 hypothetical protein [Pseudomonadota bacterium]
MRRQPLQVFLTVALLVTAIGLVQTVTRLRTARAQLSDNGRELERLRQELKDLKADTLARQARPTLPDSTAELELARLRNEVTRLRAEQKTASARAPSVRGPGPTAATPPVPGPTEIYSVSADVSANVSLGQALAVGGWESQVPGRRIVGLVTPELTPDTSGAVLMTTQLIELPDGAMETFGLQGLRTALTNSATHSVFSAEQLKALLAKAHSQDGVDLLAAPRVLTMSGQAAEISVTQPNSDGIQLGPRMRLTPTLDATGTTVRLDLHLELNQERAPRP